MNPKAYRLPRQVLPCHYDIALEASVDDPAFGGRVAIQVEIRAPQTTIELHARDLQLAAVRLTAGGAVLPGTVELDAARELAVIRFAQALPVGAATLEIAFRGQVSKGLEGLYLAMDGPERLLCTQCEATAARAIIPCFDEPTFKARFAWQITTAPDAAVLANGVLAGTAASADGRTKTWTFAPTKPMSTYLLALVIGAIAGTPEAVAGGVPLRVWAPVGKEPLGAFAAAYTARLLPWYEDYFAVPYHWEKLDQVAVPGFAAGAMENVGLVLYRQSALLMNPHTTSWQQEKQIAEIVAHEFAHMWFGNLVTMEWWDDLWLNEAFATWAASRAVDALTPEYEVWDDFQRSKMGALAADALVNTHPIYSPVETPGDASEMFDVITYQKGCAVLRMVEHFLGAPAFRAGIRRYLQEHREGNATGHDLWAALQATSHEPVTRIMDAWVRQGGYPVIDIDLDETAGAPALQLHQQRFYSSPEPGADAQTLWLVPLVIRYAGDGGVHEIRHLLTARREVLPLPLTDRLAWCYANAGELGFYRQRLAPALLRGLLAHLDQLAPAEQMGLLSDQWALVRNGSGSIAPFLDVLAALAGRDEHRVLALAVDHLHGLADLLDDAHDPAALARFRAWVGATFAPKLADLGFAPQGAEPQNRVQARVAVVDAMTRLAQDPAALAQARAGADREAADPAAVDANLAALLLAAAAQFGDSALFDRYVRIYEERRAAGAAPQQTDRYLLSFPHFQAPDLVARTLALLDRGTLPLQGLAPILGQMLTLHHARLAAWDYLKAHWTTFETIAPMWIPAVVSTTGQLPASLRADLVAFYDAHLHGEAQQSYARALERMDQQAAFQARIRDDLVGWFHAR